MNLLSARNPGVAADDADAAVAALYAGHALGLTRLAQVMLGDRAARGNVMTPIEELLCSATPWNSRISGPQGGPLEATW